MYTNGQYSNHSKISFQQLLQQQKIEISQQLPVVTETDIRNAFPRSQAVNKTPEVAPKASSRPVSMEVDGAAAETGDSVVPLETVAKAVQCQQKLYSSSSSKSPKCHSRSSSHDSYFEQRGGSAVTFDGGDDDAGSDLDISEIQMNFDLEDNEMRIFSEDEAMLSCSVGSDLSRRSAAHDVAAAVEPTSPKARMSFREKFRRFTSPGSNRKTGNNETAASSLKDKLVSSTFRR